MQQVGFISIFLATLVTQYKVNNKHVYSLKIAVKNTFISYRVSDVLNQHRDVNGLHVCCMSNDN